MNKPVKTLFAVLIFSISLTLLIPQITPWASWTLLPSEQMDEIIGETSGETAWKTVMETGGYNKDRTSAEYSGTFYEAQYIYDQLKKYDISGARIARYKAKEVWDGLKGELWEVKPRRQKLASYQDVTALLAEGSTDADVQAELVWVGAGSKTEIEKADVKGKIVVTEGYLNSVHKLACLDNQALGVVCITARDPYFDPLAIPWSGIYNRDKKKKSKFGFFIPVREGALLKRRLLRKEKITVHARVEVKQEPYEYQNVVAYIPGRDYPGGEEVIFSAHLFEGITKQGANDNKSGSAAILEVARVLNKLINEKRLPRPKRTIRFLWGPEYSGTSKWISDNKKIMSRTLCNINMDMVGVGLKKAGSFLCLMRTTYGNPHYINDVMENYYRFVGEGNRNKIHNWGSKFLKRIVAPSGSADPFYYKIDPHFGASDHEVFNNWTIRVPGIMMITWPDPWYHTSKDRIQQIDPTQLKRVVVIGASAAYTIANASDFMAVKIAGETSSNGSRRLGHALMMGLEGLNKSTKKSLKQDYKRAVHYYNAALENELLTLFSLNELAVSKDRIGNHLRQLSAGVRSIGDSHLETLRYHMEKVAGELNTSPVNTSLTKEEKKLQKIVPRVTEKIKTCKYGDDREIINETAKKFKKKYPYHWRDIASSGELHLLIDGKRNLLQIINIMDAQARKPSKIKGVLNYLHILKKAGLIDF